MTPVSYLFDVDPYTRKNPFSYRRRPMSPRVRAALARLKRTIEAIPAEEWEVRRQRWEDLQRHLHSS